MDPVRFAILSFGHHASRRLAPAFLRSKQVLLTGLWRRDRAAAAKAAAEFSVRYNFATREELCASPDVDAVFITSPDAMHLEDALLAIRHGKAVLCEKPLAMNGEEAREIEAAAKSAGVLFGVGQNFRFNRSMEWLREKVASGALGRTQLAHAQFTYPAQTAPRKWITDATLATGGPIADVGVHCIDALRFVLGEDVLSVDTLAAKDELSGAVEAYASMQMEMTGGVQASVTVSARAPYRTLVEVVGSEGSLSSESAFTVDKPVEVIQRRAGEIVDRATVDNGDGYVRMLDNFAEAFRGRGSFLASGSDGVRNQMALDAAYRSWHSGRREVL